MFSLYSSRVGEVYDSTNVRQVIKVFLTKQVISHFISQLYFYIKLCMEAAQWYLESHSLSIWIASLR